MALVLTVSLCTSRDRKRANERKQRYQLYRKCIKVGIKMDLFTEKKRKFIKKTNVW